MLVRVAGSTCCQGIIIAIAPPVRLLQLRAIPLQQPCAAFVQPLVVVEFRLVRLYSPPHRDGYPLHVHSISPRPLLQPGVAALPVARGLSMVLRLVAVPQLRASRPCGLVSLWWGCPYLLEFVALTSHGRRPDPPQTLPRVDSQLSKTRPQWCATSGDRVIR